MHKRLAALACALVLASCVSPPEDIDRVVEYDPDETYMGVIQERGELLVGIPREPVPPFSFGEEAGPDAGGFFLDLANEVAVALGVDVEPVFLDEEELILPG